MPRTRLFRRAATLLLSLSAAAVLAIVSHPGSSAAECSDPTLFKPRVDYACGPAPHGATIADFNSDGIPDLAVASSDAAGSSNGSVAVLLGQGGSGVGDGTFAAASFFPAGVTPYGLAACDFNADGITDLAVANVGSANVSILIGLGSGGVGSGSFAPPRSFPAGSGPFGIVAGDFNEDGITDLALPDNGTARVSVLIGTGSGGVWDGGFAAPAAYPIASISTGIAAADFNEDGITDLVATCNYASSLAVLLGRGSGGVGDGTFAPAVSAPANTEPFAVAVADFNEDGILDLASGDAGHNGVAILLGQGSAGTGSGSFGAATIFNDGVQNAGIAVGDFNDDGILDLATGDARNNVVYAMLGQGSSGVGNGTFAGRTFYSAGASSFPLAGGDLDEDGQLDVVAVNFGAGSVSVLIGTCEVGPPPPPPPPSNAPTLTGVRDVPNDQGGHVFLTWLRSRLDVSGSAPIAGYRIWRRIPPEIGAAALRAQEAGGEPRGGARVTRTAGSDGAAAVYWEAIAERPAQQLEGYGYTAATTQDSLRHSNPYTAFFVTTLTDDPGVFYSSEVDSGYSVDNLPPRRPGEPTAQLRAEGVLLRWLASPDEDVTTYRVYRGATADFACDARHRLAETTECLYLDRGSAGGEFYKLTAVDRHENEGEAVTLGPVGAGGAGAGELEFALHGVQPNPATERNLTVEFTLPDAGPARLTLLDMAGRLVASRDVGAPGAGRQRVNLAEGMKLRAGVYVVRLVQRGRTRTVKAAVVP